MYQDLVQYELKTVFNNVNAVFTTQVCMATMDNTDK